MAAAPRYGGERPIHKRGVTVFVEAVPPSHPMADGHKVVKKPWHLRVFDAIEPGKHLALCGIRACSLG